MTKSVFAAALLGALLLFGPTDQAAAQNCSNVQEFRSPGGPTQATSVTFVNKGPESRRIFWIDARGQRKFYKEIGPGQSYTQPTFAGHPWIAAREDDRCQTVVVATPRPMTVDVTRSCLTGRIGDDGKCIEDGAPQRANTAGCQGGSWRGNTCVCPRGQTFDAGRCVASGGDHGGVNCASSGTFYDGISCVRKCPAGTTGRNGMCQ
jgi:hypothetical protein